MRSIINRFNWSVVWYWWKLPLFVVALIVAGWLIYGCAPKYPYTPVSIPQEAEFKDPLAIDHKQKESVALYVSKYGTPEIMFGWAGDEFKVEVLRWKKPNTKSEKWAIRVNNVYKFTWTQFNIEKPGEVKK